MRITVGYWQIRDSQATGYKRFDSQPADLSEHRAKAILVWIPRLLTLLLGLRSESDRDIVKDQTVVYATNIGLYAVEFQDVEINAVGFVAD